MKERGREREREKEKTKDWLVRERERGNERIRALPRLQNIVSFIGLFCKRDH